MRQILYIPGLGDAKPTGWIVKRWQNSSRKVTIFDTKWSTKETHLQKYTRLKKMYHSISNQGEVQIVAISAGGSLATKLLSEFPEIKSAKLISCKLKDTTSIGSNFQKLAPALIESVAASERALKSVENYQHKITVYRPLIEWLVPLGDMIAGDSKTKRIPAIGHAMGIGIALIFYAP